MAISKRHGPGFVKELLLHGASVDTTDNKEQIPLHLVCRQKASENLTSDDQVEMVKMLLEKEDSSAVPDKEGKTALYYAEKHQLSEVAKELKSNKYQAQRTLEVEEAKTN
ncbi:hypothetical protein F4803DRAFT_535984 [Xylaria telfairii]|nr:hypothetical protein F4803DRAFT_535984 [Xylaria telfairii]